MKEKRYIVRKYVMATSASDALKKEKKQRVDEVYVDDKWFEEQTKKAGFGK